MPRLLYALLFVPATALADAWILVVRERTVGPSSSGVSLSITYFPDTYNSKAADLLPNLPSFIRRVCSGYAPDRGVLRTQLV